MDERKPAEVFHPGEHLLDELDARGWTQIEFAEIIGRPGPVVNEIVNGKRGVTPETAREFAAALGTSAEFWMNLDNAYNLWKSNKDVSSIIHRGKMRSLFPIRDMIIRGWIIASEETQVVESQLFRFFEISSLDERPQLVQQVATKRSAYEGEELSPKQIAWLYRVKQIAETQAVAKYSKELLENAIYELEGFREAPEKIREIPQLLEKCGVRLVIVESLPSLKIDGVTFWLDQQRSPVIGLSIRFDRIDNFWFVLRHEIEHVLNEHGKTAPIVDLDIENTSIEEDLEEEKIANKAAAEFCVPQRDLDGFIDRVGPLFSRASVLEFANKHKLHPGLVVGQLQRHLKRYDLFRPLLVSVRSIIMPVAKTDGFGYVFQVKI
jgi:HTH-type transcriptional regulator/antitoxin HigA